MPVGVVSLLLKDRWGRIRGCYIAGLHIAVTAGISLTKEDSSSVQWW